MIEKAAQAAAAAEAAPTPENFAAQVTGNITAAEGAQAAATKAAEEAVLQARIAEKLPLQYSVAPEEEKIREEDSQPAVQPESKPAVKRVEAEFATEPPGDFATASPEESGAVVEQDTDVSDAEAYVACAKVCPGLAEQASTCFDVARK